MDKRVSTPVIHIPLGDGISIKGGISKVFNLAELHINVTPELWCKLVNLKVSELLVSKDSLKEVILQVFSTNRAASSKERFVALNVRLTDNQNIAETSTRRRCRSVTSSKGDL